MVGIVEFPGYFISPQPPDFDMNDVEAVKARAAKAPLLAQLGLALAWGLGPLAGELVACLIARRSYWAHGAIIGGIFILADVLELLDSDSALADGRRRPSPRRLPQPSEPPSLGGWLFPPKTGSPQRYDMRERNMAC